MDAGHKETEKILEDIEKRISAEYRTAEKEIQEKLDDYLRRFQIKDDLKRKALDNGLITQKEYNEWRIGQIMMGKRWAEVRDNVARDLTEASQTARNIAFGEQPDVFATNYNFGTYQVEKAARIDTSFTMYDKNAFNELVKNEDTFIPAPGRKVQREINTGKQLAWDKKQVQSVMMQGILQGKSIPDLASSLAKTVGESDRKAAIRNARTLTTGVQNAGRVASYERANNMGIETQKQWLASLDDRTRHWHAALDGEKVDNDEPFTNEYGDIMYPGDPSADPANIFNCRCTLIASIKGFERDVSDIGQRNSKLGSMSYDDWKAVHYEQRSDSITKQDDIAERMQNAYKLEYMGYARNNNKMYKENDPMLDALGSIEQSHPEEMKKFIEYAKNRNVEVDLDSPSIGYSPGLKKGQPGQLHVSTTDSYGAWLHEMQHLYDDEKMGWGGYEPLFDVAKRSEMEYNAYKQEIELARRIGRKDIEKQLKEACEVEIRKIGGVWDARKLK